MTFVGLAVTELTGRLGVEDVVDPRRPAAQVALGDLLQHQAGYAAQQLARLAADPLGVAEVAGVVVGDGDVEGVPLGPRADLDEELRDVADLGTERPRPLDPLGFVGEQVLVVLHRRPAAGGVDDDRVDAGPLELLDEGAGEPLGLLLAAVVRGQGATAPLRALGDDVEALGAQHPGGRRVDAREELALHAAEQHADDPAPGAARRGPLGDPLRLAELGGQALHRRERRRQPVEQTGTPQGLGQAGALVEPQRSPRRPQPLGVREQREDPLAQRLVGRGAFVPALDLGAGVLDEPVVLHAGRAGGHAGHAAEAGVEVADHRVGHRLAAEALVHEVDAAARASPSPRPRGRRSGRPAGRTRSARSRRRARPRAACGRRRRRGQPGRTRWDRVPRGPRPVS